MKRTVRNCVKEMRNQKGYTQIQLAEKVEVTRQTIIAIEKQRYEPYIATALNLAEALDCTVDELFWIEESH
ncbi:MAG TPA: helix-turn-helix transcriptional regulator [Virgibacillus sp.]|nr:helix-turn-helix transcriptional regulator [Virgibacillus sp.]